MSTDQINHLTSSPLESSTAQPEIGVSSIVLNICNLNGYLNDSAADCDNNNITNNTNAEEEDDDDGDDDLVSAVANVQADPNHQIQQTYKDYIKQNNPQSNSVTTLFNNKLEQEKYQAEYRHQSQTGESLNSKSNDVSTSNSDIDSLDISSIKDVSFFYAPLSTPDNESSLSSSSSSPSNNKSSSPLLLPPIPPPLPPLPPTLQTSHSLNSGSLSASSSSSSSSSSLPLSSLSASPSSPTSDGIVPILYRTSSSPAVNSTLSTSFNLTPPPLPTTRPKQIINTNVSNMTPITSPSLSSSSYSSSSSVSSSSSPLVSSIPKNSIPSSTNYHSDHTANSDITSNNYHNMINLSTSTISNLPVLSNVSSVKSADEEFNRSLKKGALVDVWDVKLRRWSCAEIVEEKFNNINPPIIQLVDLTTGNKEWIAKTSNKLAPPFTKSSGPSSPPSPDKPLKSFITKPIIISTTNHHPSIINSQKLTSPVLPPVAHPLFATDQPNAYSASISGASSSSSSSTGTTPTTTVATNTGSSSSFHESIVHVHEDGRTSTETVKGHKVHTSIFSTNSSSSSPGGNNGTDSNSMSTNSNAVLPPPLNFGSSLILNDVVDCIDTDRVWRVATVIQCSKNELLIHYEGWSSKWDEWISRTSARILPPRTKTEGYTGPPKKIIKQNNNSSLFSSSSSYSDCNPNCKWKRVLSMGLGHRESQQIDNLFSKSCLLQDEYQELLLSGSQYDGVHSNIEKKINQLENDIAVAVGNLPTFTSFYLDKCREIVFTIKSGIVEQIDTIKRQKLAEEEENFMREIQQKFSIIQIPSDGNCLFTATGKGHIRNKQLAQTINSTIKTTKSTGLSIDPIDLHSDSQQYSGSNQHINQSNVESDNSNEESDKKIQDHSKAPVISESDLNNNIHQNNNKDNQLHLLPTSALSSSLSSAGAISKSSMSEIESSNTVSNINEDLIIHPPSIPPPPPPPPPPSLHDVGDLFANLHIASTTQHSDDNDTNNNYSPPQISALINRSTPPIATISTARRTTTSQPISHGEPTIQSKEGDMHSSVDSIDPPTYTILPSPSPVPVQSPHEIAVEYRSLAISGLLNTPSFHSPISREVRDAVNDEKDGRIRNITSKMIAAEVKKKVGDDKEKITQLLSSNQVIDIYTSVMSKDGIYGTAIEVEALSNAIKMPIHVYYRSFSDEEIRNRSDGGLIKPAIAFGEEFDSPPVTLAYYIANKHYNLLIPRPLPPKPPSNNKKTGQILTASNNHQYQKKDSSSISPSLSYSPLKDIDNYSLSTHLISKDQTFSTPAAASRKLSSSFSLNDSTFQEKTLGQINKQINNTNIHQDINEVLSGTSIKSNVNSSTNSNRRNSNDDNSSGQSNNNGILPTTTPSTTSSLFSFGNAETVMSALDAQVKNSNRNSSSSCFSFSPSSSLSDKLTVNVRIGSLPSYPMRISRNQPLQALMTRSQQSHVQENPATNQTNSTSSLPSATSNNSSSSSSSSSSSPLSSPLLTSRPPPTPGRIIRSIDNLLLDLNKTPAELNLDEDTLLIIHLPASSSNSRNTSIFSLEDSEIPISTDNQHQGLISASDPIVPMSNHSIDNN